MRRSLAWLLPPTTFTTNQRKLTSKKSSGYDIVLSFFVKNASPTILETLTLTVNLSFPTGRFSQVLKVNNVDRIFKKVAIIL